MQSFIFFLLPLLSTALALPSSKLATLHTLTADSPTCTLPDAGQNCAGYTFHDVIIQYGKASPEQQALILDVAKSAGGKIIYDMADFGFSGLVPSPVVQMIKAAGESYQLKVHENACAEIPWCGEAPC